MGRRPPWFIWARMRPSFRQRGSRRGGGASAGSGGRGRLGRGRGGPGGPCRPRRGSWTALALAPPALRARLRSWFGAARATSHRRPAPAGSRRPFPGVPAVAGLSSRCRWRSTSLRGAVQRPCGRSRTSWRAGRRPTETRACLVRSPDDSGVASACPSVHLVCLSRLSRVITAVARSDKAPTRARVRRTDERAPVSAPKACDACQHN